MRHGPLIPFSRIAIGAALTVIVAAGCTGDLPTQNGPESEQVPVASTAAQMSMGQTRVDVCHVNGQGDYKLITIAEAAYQTHVDHGDAGPGDPVPGLAHHVFGTDCQAVFDWQWSVEGDGAYDRPGSSGYFRISAQSLVDGLSPTGTVYMLATPTPAGAHAPWEVHGRVTCLAVAGNRAAIGFFIETGVREDDGGPVDLTGQGLVLIAQDGPDAMDNSGFITDGNNTNCQNWINATVHVNPDPYESITITVR